MTRFRTVLALLVAAIVTPASAFEDLAPRDGWEVHRSDYAYADLSTRVREAVSANGLAVVTRAGPTGAAKKRGIEIPGNTVIGAFNNDYAVRILSLSTAAMIEAPVRLYVTENTDGTGTVSYKRPSTVFGPYMEEGGAELEAAASDLDTVFAAIVADAVAR